MTDTLRSSVPRTATSSAGQAEDDLRRLGEELTQRMGRRNVTVLAVGSVGWAHMEARSAVDAHVADYDLIVVADHLTEPERVLHRRRIDRWLGQAAGTFALPVAVGILHRSALPRLPFTLFNYEMRYAHRVLAGADPTDDMPLYRADQMPLIEATRLLLNRGVLLWGDSLLSGRALSQNETALVAQRNRKALLAMGDALLMASRAYHWSYRVRLARVADCSVFDHFQSAGLRGRYAGALEGKIDGDAGSAEGCPPREQAASLLELHAAVFRCVEERRLRRTIADWREYATAMLHYPRYLAPSRLKRLARLVRAFGAPRGNGFYRRHGRYAPEEVLLGAFPSLAYGGAEPVNPRHMLNWQPRGSPTSPTALWHRFHSVWARGA